MKNRLITLTIIFFSCLSYSSNAQEVSDKESSPKNYIISNISYSLSEYYEFRTGSAIGIVYHRMFFDKFGANVAYSKTTKTASTDYDNTTEGINMSGLHPAIKVRLYHSANVGLSYRTTEGRHELLGAAGWNYKHIKNNYTLNFHHDNVVTTVHNYHSSTESGFYISLDYLFYLKKDFAIGIHGAYEQSHLPITNIGISLAYRF